MAPDGLTFTRQEALSGNDQNDVRFTVQPQYDSTNGARIECSAASHLSDGSMGDKLGVTLKAAALRTNSIGEEDDQCGQITVNTPELLVNGDIGATGNVNAEGNITAQGILAAANCVKGWAVCSSGTTGTSWVISKTSGCTVSGSTVTCAGAHCGFAFIGVNYTAAPGNRSVWAVDRDRIALPDGTSQGAIVVFL